MLENSLPPGQLCEIRLELFVNGESTVMHLEAKIINCIFSKDAYRVGLQFLKPTASLMQLISSIP